MKLRNLLTIAVAVFLVGGAAAYGQNALVSFESQPEQTASGLTASAGIVGFTAQDAGIPNSATTTITIQYGSKITDTTKLDFSKIGAALADTFVTAVTAGTEPVIDADAGTIMLTLDGNDITAFHGVKVTGVLIDVTGRTAPVLASLASTNLLFTNRNDVPLINQLNQGIELGGKDIDGMAVLVNGTPSDLDGGIRWNEGFNTAITDGADLILKIDPDLPEGLEIEVTAGGDATPDVFGAFDFAGDGVLSSTQDTVEIELHETDDTASVVLDFTLATMVDTVPAQGFAVQCFDLTATLGPDDDTAVPGYANDPIPAGGEEILCVEPAETNIWFQNPTWVENTLLDTGFALHNGTQDTLGSNGAVPQDGACDWEFYPSDAEMFIWEDPEVIESGNSKIFLLSDALTAAGFEGTSFQGYVIARCGFTSAHGIDFIFNGSDWAQGYQGDIILSPRPGKEETWGN